MDKTLTLKLNGARTVTGVLRGFDPFMNLVIDETVEHTKSGQKNNIGMVILIICYICVVSDLHGLYKGAIYLLFYYYKKHSSNAYDIVSKVNLRSHLFFL